MEAPRPPLTAELLEALQAAALDNAAALESEAKLLFEREHYARAYFLGVASIEETGKAALSFRARGRNLRDGGVVARIGDDLQSHRTKITAAFTGWLHASPIREETVNEAVKLSLDLKYGREPTMYTDITDDGKVSTPLRLVGERQAKDCISIASNCLHHMKQYLQGRAPQKVETFEDRFLTISRATQRKIFGLEDFSKFLLDQVEKDPATFDLFKLLVLYHDKFFVKGKLFSRSGDE